jgi:hypothetical protein
MRFDVRRHLANHRRCKTSTWGGWCSGSSVLGDDTCDCAGGLDAQQIRGVHQVLSCFLRFLLKNPAHRMDEICGGTLESFQGGLISIRHAGEFRC